VTVEQLRRSPLAGLDRRPAGVRITEEPFASAVNLRCTAPARLAGVLGAAPPPTPGTVTAAGERHLLWLGPDEWLVVGPDGDAPALVTVLREALAGAPAGPGRRASAVDVSAGWDTVAVRGERAREVLEHGCPVDLHPRAFGPGRCAQTLLGRVPVILWQAGQAHYRLLVRPSFAAHLAAWLIDAAA
jgi:sarcosine oxidase, subunit gamma